RLDELGGGIDGAAGFACITVLILGVAVRALTLDVAVGQEHALDRVIELLDGFAVDEAGVLQAPINLLGQFYVLGRMRGMPVVELDMKAVQILRALGRISSDQLLGCDFLGLSL